MSGDPDLSGQWTGVYNYPAHYPPNTFEATIRETGGLITGVIRQPGEYFEPAGTMQHAVIEGRRTGNSVSFVKVYDDLGRATPHYRGIVQAGGDEIEGEWTIPGDWSGTFLMIRSAKTAKAEERHVSEKV
ncbi:MAG: hypothetical protein KF780_03290 [Sphingomonas sp.]|nr:hypothetical protein [Sphingomonas sp.]